MLMASVMPAWAPWAVAAETEFPFPKNTDIIDENRIIVNQIQLMTIRIPPLRDSMCQNHGICWEIQRKYEKIAKNI